MYTTQYFTHVIWDFNGTILDDLELCRSTLNKMLCKRSIAPLDLEQYRAVFGFPISDYYKRVGFDFEKESYEILAHEYIDEYLPKSFECKLHDGVFELIRDLHDRGISQIVLSASDTTILKDQLKNLGILDYFDTVLGLDNIYAHSKVEIAKEWMKNTKPYRPLLIGDTVHDYEVACELGIKCVLIANGHHSYEHLCECDAHVYHDIAEFRPLVDSRPIATYQYVDLPRDRRILVTSDIHGNLKCLKEVLSKANYSEDDILIVNGDMTERGADSLGVLRYIMELSKTRTVYVTMGNCDIYVLWTIANPEIISDKAAKDTTNIKERLITEMCEELGYKSGSDFDMKAVRPLLWEKFKPELDFIRSLPTFLETQKLFFVHGGAAHHDYTKLDAFNCMKFDRFIEDSDMCFEKPCIVGHWPATLYRDKLACAYPYHDKERNIISIDGGLEVKYDGQLNLLIFENCDSTDYTVIYSDGLETVKVSEHQDASDDPIHIRFGHNNIELLEKGEEFSTCRYGEHVFDIPNTYIYEEHGQHKSWDYSHYELPVEIGDELSVIMRTSRGLIAKKDGCTGWYHGKIIE